MQKKKMMPFLKWTLYYWILLIFFVLQTTPKLFEFFGVKPILILPLCVCVCMFEDVVPSGIFATITGILWDISSDKLLGFNAMILLLCGVFVSLFCIYYLHTKLTNALLFCGVVLIIQGLINYLFYFAIWHYSNEYLILIKDILPSMIYTLVLVTPIYFLVRKISVNFNEVSRV